MRTGYMVSYVAFDYNDEYNTCIEDAYRYDRKVYASKEAAEKVAYEANCEHARTVLNETHEWTYGEGTWMFVDNCANQKELYRRVFRKEPGDGYTKELGALENIVDGLPEGESFTDEDIAWFAENCSLCRYARVEEVDVEE